MNWFEKQYNKIIDVISEKPTEATENFETLILRGGAELQVEAFEKGKTVYLIGIDGKVELKDDLWDLENGTQFRTVDHKITEIIKPKQQFNFETIVFESEDEKTFISECIREVMDAGETDDNQQAYAICKSKYDEKKSEIMEEKLETTETAEIVEVVEDVKDEKYVELEEKLSVLEQKLNALEEKLGSVDMSKYTETENFNSFKTEIDERIKKINGSVPLQKIDMENTELSDYERFMYKSLHK